jgi:Flp pilus assembly protein TadD
MLRHVLVALLALSLTASACNLGKSKSDQAQEAVDRGLEAHFAGRIDEAASDYHQALDLDPRNKFALYNLGVIEDQAGRAKSAENYYRLALSVDPDFSSALFNLAILRTAGGDTGEAIGLYRHIVAVEPDNAAAHNNLGYALRSVGQEADGNAEITRASQLDTHFAAPQDTKPGQ